MAPTETALALAELRGKVDAMDKHADERNSRILESLEALRGDVKEASVLAAKAAADAATALAALKKPAAGKGGPDDSDSGDSPKSFGFRITLRPTTVREWLLIAVPILGMLAGYGVHGAADMYAAAQAVTRLAPPTPIAGTADPAEEPAP